MAILSTVACPILMTAGLHPYSRAHNNNWTCWRSPATYISTPLSKSCRPYIGSSSRFSCRVHTRHFQPCSAESLRLCVAPILQSIASPIQTGSGVVLRFGGRKRNATFKMMCGSSCASTDTVRTPGCSFWRQLAAVWVLTPRLSRWRPKMTATGTLMQ